MKFVHMPYEKEIPVEIEKFYFENGELFFTGRLDGGARFYFRRIRKQADEDGSNIEIRVGRWLSVGDLIKEMGTEGAAEEMGWDEEKILNDYLGYMRETSGIDKDEHH